MKVGIVGAGMVGGAAANALVLRSAASEVILVDRNHKRAVAEAEDIMHATPFAYITRVRAGDYDDLAGGRAAIPAARPPHKPGGLCGCHADVGGIQVVRLARQIGRPLNDEIRARIDQGVRPAAYRIIEGKDATWHGIAGGLTRIIQSIGGNEDSMLTVSIMTEKVEGVGPIALSLPRIVGRAGVVRPLRPRLDVSEQDALRRSAATIEEALAGR